MNKPIIAILALTLIAAIACTDAAKPPTAVKTTAPAVAETSADDHDGENAPRISLADAKKDFDNKTAVFIDTRSKEQYDAEHILGAINITANTIKTEINKIPKGKKIIAYCS